MTDTIATIHRFRDSVTLTMPGGPTCYLTAAEALSLANMLLLYSNDVYVTDYSASHLRGDNVPFAAPIRS